MTCQITGTGPRLLLYLDMQCCATYTMADVNICLDFLPSDIHVQWGCVFAGVNPMITTESIAYMVGEGMAAKYSKLLKRRSPVKLQYES